MKVAQYGSKLTTADLKMTESQEKALQHAVETISNQ